MSNHFDFEPEKSLSMTAYLADQTGETMYTILKMVYIADRLHLERYGRPISGDKFFALPEGACPSKIYDSMKFIRGERKKNYMPGSENHLEVDAVTHDVTIKKMPSLDHLSASEILCLDETISILREHGRWHIRDMAHDKAWESSGRNTEMDLITIASLSDNGAQLVDHIQKRF